MPFCARLLGMGEGAGCHITVFLPVKLRGGPTPRTLRGRIGYPDFVLSVDAKEMRKRRLDLNPFGF